MLNNVLGYFGAAACSHVDHDIIEPAVAAYFFGGLIGNAKFYPAAFFVNGFDAGFDNTIFAVMHVVKHIDIIGPYAKFGFEGSVGGSGGHRTNMRFLLECCKVGM